MNAKMAFWSNACTPERFTYTCNVFFWIISLFLLGLQLDSNTNSRLTEVQSCLLNAIGNLPTNISNEIKNIKKRNIEKVKLCYNLKDADMFLKIGSHSVNNITHSQISNIISMYNSCVIRVGRNQTCMFRKAPKSAPMFCYIYLKISPYTYFCFSAETDFTGLVLSNTSLNFQQASVFFNKILEYQYERVYCD